MSVRMRGLLVTIGSVLVAAAMFWFRPLVDVAGGGGALGGALKYLMGLPVIGMGIGLVELATGLPMQQADTGWQKAPGLVKYPLAIVGSVLFLWGFLWAVSKALGA